MVNAIVVVGSVMSGVKLGTVAFRNSPKKPMSRKGDRDERARLDDSTRPERSTWNTTVTAPLLLLVECALRIIGVGLHPALQARRSSRRWG